MHVVIAFHPASWIIRRQIERLARWHVTKRSRRSFWSHALCALHNADRRTFAHKRVEPWIYTGNLRRRDVGTEDTSFTSGGAAPRASGMLVCCWPRLSPHWPSVPSSAPALRSRPVRNPRFRRHERGRGRYNRGDFKTAIEHFTSAASLEPANLKPKLFLANALMRDFYAQEGRRTHGFLRLLAGNMKKCWRDMLATSRR